MLINFFCFGFFKYIIKVSARWSSDEVCVQKTGRKFLEHYFEPLEPSEYSKDFVHCFQLAHQVLHISIPKPKTCKFSVLKHDAEGGGHG